VRRAALDQTHPRLHPVDKAATGRIAGIARPDMLEEFNLVKDPILPGQPKTRPVWTGNG
jgi:hypothetical protein